jgi:MoxR-like ATPase
MSESLEKILNLKQLVSQSVIGQSQVVEALILGLLCNGNLLLEGLPGTAKTRSIRSLSKALDASLGRIQFTPDLLPSDVTGTDIYHEVNGKQQLDFQPGPIFNNLILADEINRAPAKVQSALLEAMEERQVTVAGKTRKLPQLFMVMATQNPIEQEGTYPLPEAQMDRFLLKTNVDYPDGESEVKIMDLVRGEEITGTDTTENPIEQDSIFQARDEIHNIHVSDILKQYIVDLVMATRRPETYESELKQWLEVGSSPRATICLDKATRATAWLNGRDFASPDDVRSVVHCVMRHRLILSYEAMADGVTPDMVIDEIIKQVAVA